MTNHSHYNSVKSGWTKERNEKLRELWKTGLSCSKIAAKMGGITRNAVIGKAHRLGLESRPSPVTFSDGSDRTMRRRVTKAHKEINTVVAPLFDDEPAPTRRATPVMIGSSTATCQWPHGDVGEPNFSFCGEMSVTGRPYCAAHHKRSVMPPRPRARVIARH